MYIIIFLCSVLLITKITDSSSSMYNAKHVGEESLSIVEYYKIDDYLYMFFSERVTWEEAETICPNYGARLAVVNTPFKANKLAAAMAESNIEMEDMWIGGQRSDSGTWTWLNKNKIPIQPSHGFPPWVRNPNRPMKQCVALHRFAIDLPLFVDLDCRLPKPFICQRDVDAPGNLDVALPSHMITDGKSTYILYHSRVSWAIAAAFCRIRGYRLAIIPDNEIAKLVSTAMIRSRPSFENVWLSGHFYHNKWTWLPTDETMQSYPNEHNYPPWHHNSTHQTSGCILLDRHVCDDPVFLAFSCDHKRDFVCEEYPKSPKHHKKSKVKNIVSKNLRMILVLKELSWSEAQDYCLNENSYLTEIYNYDMMKTITTVMSDQESEPVHVWLGGMFIDDKWTWVKSNKTIPITSNKTGFIPWCDIEQREDDNCLNMDREAHDKPVVYGLNCEMKQPFVCTLETSVKPRHGSGCKQPAIPLKRGNFIIFFTSYSYESTFHQCTKAGGKLAEVKQENIDEIMNSILNTTEVCREMNFWIQAKSKCSQFNLLKKTIDVASDCTKKQGFICKTICTTPESVGLFNHTTWKCEGDDRPECKPECNNNSVLIGPDAVTCTDSGWVTNSKKTTYLPFCRRSELFMNDEISSIGDAVSKYSGFLFITDESYSVSTEEWWTQLQFIASIIQVFPLSTNWAMGLILFSSRVRVPIPYEATDTCQVLETLSKLTPDKDRDFTYVNEALKEADNQIKKFHKNEPSIIFVISDGDDNGEDFDEIMKYLKERHLIISIGISVEPLKDLNELASMEDNQLLMYKFPQFTFFKNHTLELMEYRSKDLNCPDHLYTLPNGTKKNIPMKVKKRQYVPTNDTFCDDKPTSIKLNGVTYNTFYLRLTYSEAKLHCTSEGGRLANVKQNQLEVIVNSLINNAKSCNDEEFWINRMDLPCLVLDVNQKEINNCTKDIDYTKLSFICENGCLDPPTDKKYIYNSWNCKNHGKLKNCHVKCKGKSVMVGTNIIICRADGWVALNNQSTNFPVCLTNTEFENEFISQIGKLKEEHDGFLFVFDEAPHYKSGQNGTLKQLDFMKIMLEIFPPSENFPVGLILLDEDARVEIPYNETNFCLIRRKLHHLKHTPTVNSPKNRQSVFNKGLLEAERQITTLQPTRKTLIFFISDRTDSGNNYSVISNNLKKKHTIFSIGNNYDGLKDLSIIASMNSDDLLMYTFKSYEHLDYTMKIIKQHHGKHYECAGDV